MATDNTVAVEQSGGIATLKLTRPLSLDSPGKRAILGAVQQLGREGSVRALIIAADHPEAFLVDVNELVKMTPREAKGFSEAGHAMANALTTLPFPTIAAVEGLALGGGCELVLSCDLAYASENAKFGQIETMGGVIPGFGGSWKLAQRVGMQRAMEMICTADVIDARRAKDIGLVLDVVRAEDLLAHCRAIARRIANNGQLAVSRAKKVLVAAGAPPSAVSNLEQEEFASLFGTPDQQGRMVAYLKQRTHRAS